MIEKIAKMAENCAERSANSSCMFAVLFHQPKMPKSLVKKDEE
jgi:cyclic lactone autoinducer peptide